MIIKEFANWLASISSVSNVVYQADKVYFIIHDEATVLKITTVAEKSKTVLTLHTNGKGIMFCLHGANFSNFMQVWNENDKSKINSKNGIPDLSLVTCKQIANELKKRKNLTFALIYAEENDADNISLDGNGDPNKLVGLIARGLNLSIQWADKNMKFEK